MNLAEQLKNSFSIHKSNNAFCINGAFYTYELLLSKISAIALSIQSKVDKNRKNIGVVTNNDIETYSSLIACWLTGSAYIPISPATPKERNDHIIHAAGIGLILTSSNEIDSFVGTNDDLKVIDTSTCKIDATEDLDITGFDESSLAYVLFTSGSTGSPKGVPITQRNLFNFTQNFKAAGFTIESSDRCLQMFELTFDVSISSFLPALLAGACVYTAPNDGIKYIQVLKLIQQHQLTSIQIVPSIIKLGRKFLKSLKFPWVKACILTGEATFVDLIPEWKDSIPNAVLYNFYGPTETTIYCSFFECKQDIKQNNGMLAIGKPMGEMQLLIVDEDENEVALNEKGELLIGGGQLSGGYLSDEAKTKNAFIELKARGGQIFYRSGDMCYKDEEGDIYYCGRYDNQVKIQGFRVELGEIEYLVRDEFGLNNIVAVFENKQQLPELILILETRGIQNADNILNYLKTKLPLYMIPARIENLAEFPLTTSGKTDRKEIRSILSGGLTRNNQSA